MKQCTRCKIALPEWRSLHYCSVCANHMARERRRRDPEKVRAKEREQRRRRTEEQRERARERQRERAAKERYEKLKSRRCVICNNPVPIAFNAARTTCSDQCARRKQADATRAYYRRKTGGAPRGTEEAAKHLSDAAKQQWARGRNVKPRDCKSCGEQFTPNSPPHRYCSPACKRLSALARNYETTASELSALLEKQGHRCALCGLERKGWVFSTGSVKRKESLVVDHCHKTHKVRGFLCGDCNTALGRFGDDPERLKAAAAYLEACA